MSAGNDTRAGRLDEKQIAANFSDLHPPLTDNQAAVEAARCLFCHDAPCTEACPTGIDIPGFIRKIATGNARGAAVTILSENIMGGTCANVCPVEELCEQLGMSEREFMKAQARLGEEYCSCARKMNGKTRYNVHVAKCEQHRDETKRHVQLVWVAVWVAVLGAVLGAVLCVALTLLARP